MTQCPGHASFERMIQVSLDNLAQQIAKLAEVVTAQSRANGESLSKVLSNQADRRELCGQQNARLDNLEKSQDVNSEGHREIWSAINKLRFYVFAGVGVAAALNALVVLYIKTSH